MEQPPTLYDNKDGSHPSEADSQPADRGRKETSPHGELQMAAMTSYPAQAVSRPKAAPKTHHVNTQKVVKVAPAVKAEGVGMFSKALEAFFTLSIMFSIALTPFILVQAFAPQVMTIIISSAWSLAFIPYVIVMALIGLKVSSLFGCSAWSRITADKEETDGKSAPS